MQASWIAGVVVSASNHGRTDADVNRHLAVSVQALSQDQRISGAANDALATAVAALQTHDLDMRQIDMD